MAQISRNTSDNTSQKRGNQKNTSSQTRLYPESRVELTPFTLKYYDRLLDIGTMGFYRAFIRKAIRAMNIQPADAILDLGCGTGRNACYMAKYLGEEGKITGLDVSDIMGNQFERNCSRYPNVQFIKQRIDEPFTLKEQYDKVFMSFVFHGFPHDVRKTILQNVLDHLKEGGTLNIVDYAEFDIHSAPLYFRIPFNIVEGKCKYAYDFIAKDWKTILGNHGFGRFQETFFAKNHLRLLKAAKVGE